MPQKGAHNTSRSFYIFSPEFEGRRGGSYFTAPNHHTPLTILKRKKVSIIHGVFSYKMVIKKVVKAIPSGKTRNVSN